MSEFGIIGTIRVMSQHWMDGWRERDNLDIEYRPTERQVKLAAVGFCVDGGRE